MKSTKCPSCQATINEKDSFCYSCGAKVEKNKPNICLIITIDFISTVLLSIILAFILYTTYNIFQYPRIAASIGILISCPFVWGTIIYLIVKRKTPGFLIATKLANNKNKTQ